MTATLFAPPVITEALDPTLLAEIADGLARADDLWRGVVRHDPTRRHPVRIVATPAYEVWVIGWMPGQGVEMHDHGCSVGHIVVAEGTLTEIAPSPEGPVSHALPAGAGKALPLGTIHDVVNRSDTPATSIHVYSPPLDAMTFYDPSTLTPTHTDPGSWGDAQAVIEPVEIGRALHPARHG